MRMIDQILTQLISIHALHEESDTTILTALGASNISIHALHEESESLRLSVHRLDAISIHALHEESDISNVGAT